MVRASLASFDLANLAWTQLWQLTITILLVAVLTHFCCRRRPHLAYLLWMLVIVKALTPPVLASRAGIYSWLLRSEAPVAVVAEMAPSKKAPLLFAPGRENNFGPLRSPKLAESAATEPMQAKPLDEPGWFAALTVGQALFWLWLCGVVSLGLYVVAKWWACRRRWLEAAVPVLPSFDQLVRDMARQLEFPAGTARRLRILVSRAADSPAVFGLWKPTILLPAGLMRSGKGEAQRARLDAILAHELIHLRRGDTVAAELQLAAQLIWWFHPLVWYANREARRERERACDEEVVMGLGCKPAEYARALLDVLEWQAQKQPAFAMPGVGMMGITVRRLNHLLRHSDGFHKRTPWTYYLAMLAILLFILPGAGLQLAAAPAANPPADEVRARAVENVAGEGLSSSSSRKPVEPTIIVTGNVILWDNRIVSWDQMVLRFRTMRADGPIHPHFHFTHKGNEKIDAFQKRLFGIYKELFEPEGMSLGGMNSRASARLDRIRGEDDLRPDPALARQGRVLTPEGKSAVGAQAIVLPPKDLSPVVLSGKALRDPYDEQLTATDDDGRFTVYPENEDYCLVILHDSGCDVRPVPAAGEPFTIQLAPWGTIRFTSTGGVNDQTACVAVDPTGVQKNELRFDVYEVRVEAEPTEVPVPAGKIVILRSLKMAEGSSINMQVEQFDLAAGETREKALAPPTVADRKRAEDLQQPMREARQKAAAEREEKAKKDAAPNDQQNEASLPGRDVGLKVNAEQAGSAGEKAADDAANGSGETKKGDVTAASVSAPAKKERKFKPTGTFIPAGATPLTDPDPQQPSSPKHEVPVAVRRLRDLGALVDPAPYDGDPPGEAWNVTIRQGWKGTDDDLKLINDVPDLAFLHFDLTATSGAGIGAIRLAVPADYLSVSSLTDEAVAKISRLPAANRVILGDCSLSELGCKRLAPLAKGVEHLELHGIWDPKNRRAPSTGIDDAGLKAIGQIKNLKYLELVHLGITDSGLSGLAGLERLQEFRIMACPAVRGPGYAALQSLPELRQFSAYMMPLTGDALAGMAQLAQLEHIKFQLDRGSAAGLKPTDFAPLAKLSQLRTLDFVDPENPWATTDKTPPHEDALTHDLLGDGLLMAVAKAPQLRGLQADGLDASQAGVTALGDAHELRSLSVRPIALNDASLAALGRLTGLTRLYISGPGEIQPASLTRLAPLRNLKELSIHRAGLTDDALGTLAPIVALEYIDLPDSKIRGSGLATLAKLPKLKSLSLVRAPLDDAGCQPLVTLAALEDLNLSETKITDRALSFLVRVPKLRSLNLTGTAVTIEGLATLAELKSLKSLRVEGLKASGEALANLRQRLPGVTVDIIGNGWVISAADKDNASGKEGPLVVPYESKADDTISPAETEEKPRATSRATAGPKADGIAIDSAEEPAAKEDKKKAATQDVPDDPQGSPNGVAKTKRSQAESAHYVYAMPVAEADNALKPAGVHPISVSGRATDGEDKPVADATVYLVALGLREPAMIAQAKTNADGRYELRDAKLPLTWPEHPQGHYQVYATAPGRGLTWQGARDFRPEKRPAGGQDDQVSVDAVLVADLKFGQEATLRGRLVDETGAPINNAKVKVIQTHRLTPIDKQKATTAQPSDRHLVALMGRPLIAATDDEGRFTIPGLTKETSAYLNVTHPDFGETHYQVALTDDPAVKREGGREPIVGDANLRLERTHQFKLRLLYDTTSRPAAAATVSAWRQSAGNLFAGGKTDSDGNLTLNLAPGTYETIVKPDRATAPAGYLETQMSLVVPKEPQGKPALVRLPAGCTLDVEVLDADTGKPVPKIGIASSWDIEGEQWRQLRIIGETNDAGRFSDVVPAGKRYYGPVSDRYFDVVENSHPTSEKPIDLPGGHTIKLQFKVRKRAAEETKKE